MAFWQSLGFIISIISIIDSGAGGWANDKNDKNDKSWGMPKRVESITGLASKTHWEQMWDDRNDKMIEMLEG